MGSTFRALGLSLLALAVLGAKASPPARSAVLFIGDGMGLSTLTAARIHAHGPAGRLAMELPHTALVRTYSADRMVTDSAAAATALLCGQRVASGVIAMSSETPWRCSQRLRPDGSANPLHPCPAAARPIPSLADLASRAGLAVGLVTTTRLTHATPAALYAHVDDRWNEVGIGEQLAARDDLSFVAGGGRRLLRPPPAGTAAPISLLPVAARDHLAALAARGVRVAETGAELRAAVAAGAARILAVLAEDHLPYELERRAQQTRAEAGGPAASPSLAELTELALRHLGREGRRFLLVVEGGRIDHALHENRARLALADTLAFDAAVAVARRLTDPDETLILVTADHGQPLVIQGYALVGDPILGLARGMGLAFQDADADGQVDLLRDTRGRAMTTLLFANGPGAWAPGPRPDPAAAAAALLEPGYRQQAAIPLLAATHEGSDVVAAAIGPGAEQVRGFLEQTDLFGVVRRALGL